MKGAWMVNPPGGLAMIGLNRKKRQRQARRNPSVNRRRKNMQRWSAARRHAGTNRRRSRRNAPLALIGTANPRRHGRRRGNPRFGRRAAAGTRGMMGRVTKMLSPGWIVNTLAGGAGFLAGIAVPNWLFGGQTWYTQNKWAKVGVRAAFGLVALPLAASFLPSGIGQAMLVGAGIAVGVSALAELTDNTVIVGGAADLALTPETFFRTGHAALTGLSGVGRVFNQSGNRAGLGAYTNQFGLRGGHRMGQMGAYTPYAFPNTLMGSGAHSLAGVDH